MRAKRLEKLESKTREAHRSAWSAFWGRFRAALDGLPAGAFERFGPVDDLGDLEDALLPWDSWSNAILPVLEKAEQGDLSVWPNDLPPPPSDPSPLITSLVGWWRKHPTRSVAALLVLLALGAARWGEGGDSPFSG